MKVNSLYTILLNLYLIFLNCAQARSEIQSVKETESFYQLLQTQKSDIEYVREILSKKQVIMIGEDHWIVNHPQFLIRIINTIGLDKKSNLDVIAIEFGTADKQAVADQLVTSKKFDDKKAYDILRSTVDNWGWPYKIWIDVFRAIWQVNQIREKKLKLILTDTPYFLSEESQYSGKNLLNKDAKFLKNRDMYMYRIVEREIIDQGLRGIYYAGAAHTAKVPTSIYKSNDHWVENQSAGQILKAFYPEQVWSIKLWSPSITEKGYYPSHNFKDWGRLAGGWVDEIFEKNANKPVGFNVVGTPFEKMDDWTFFPLNQALMDKWGAKPVRRMMSQYFDAIIFTEPVSQFKGDQIISEMFDVEFLKEIARRRGLQATSKEEEIAYIKKIRPILK